MTEVSVSVPKLPQPVPTDAIREKWSSGSSFESYGLIQEFP